MIIFYKNNIGTLLLSKLMSSKYENDAVVSATLYDPFGNVVTGFSNIQGVYVPGSDGDYNFPIAELNPPEGGGYILKVKATTSYSLVGNWEMDVLVTVRSDD